MRAPLCCLAVLTLTTGACNGHDGPKSSQSQSQSQSQPAGDRVFFQGNALCVAAADTKAMTTQSPPPQPVAGCGTWPDDKLALPVVQEKSMCGPCGFSLDEAATALARAGRPDACCYQVTSPPPPPPPPVVPDAGAVR